jgi:hypothetical protein
MTKLGLVSGAVSAHDGDVKADRDRDDDVPSPVLAPDAGEGTRTDRLRWTVDLVRQIALVAGAVLLYFGVRGQTQGERTGAIRHGHDILSLEARLGIGVEHSLQSAIVGHHVLVTLFNWIYIYGHWPVLVGTLVWLYHRRRAEYMLLRNALFISGAIGLVIFMTYPVAPPRLLDAGFEDTVTVFSTAYRALQPPALINKYAAMPSLHVGWNLLVGIAIFRTARHGMARAFGLASPILMAIAVVATANHYVLDALVGSSVALIGLAASAWITPRAGRWFRRLVHPPSWVRRPRAGLTA